MIALLQAFWPILAAAFVIGVLVGRVGFRATPQRSPKSPVFRRRATLFTLAGAALVLLLGMLWHGPVGTADRLATSIDEQAQQVLVNYEMTQVLARIERDPIRRTVLLSGPADDFQRKGLAEIMHLVPGVGNVRWNDRPEPFALPLLAEVELVSLVSFGLGLLLAYLLELRRRYRAQWSW